MSVALTDLFEAFSKLTGNLPTIRYCMAGADITQFNAVTSAVASKTRDLSKRTYLMCYFHVVKTLENMDQKWLVNNCRFSPTV
ncbi:hypothetical protein L917_21536, partial [Phytophthora nicotianae]